jgi:TetR/AcrR family transcriptional regulator
MQEVLEEGIATGELIAVEPSQIRYAALGANVFFFLSAPLVQMIQGSDPLEREALILRRSTTIQYLGQTIFMDREHGLQLAERVLAATPMPEGGGISPQPTPEFPLSKTKEVRRR